MTIANIKLFEQKKIRSVWNELDQKRHFSVADVIEVLTDTVNPKDYIKKMRKRDPQLNSDWGTICPPLEMTAADGRRRQIQCANAEGLLRITARNKNAQGFPQNEKAAIEGGTVAGNARKELEKKSGQKVVSRRNFKALSDKRKRAIDRE